MSKSESSATPSVRQAARNAVMFSISGNGARDVLTRGTSPGRMALTSLQSKTASAVVWAGGEGQRE